jgi:hypothetical protein
MLTDPALDITLQSMYFNKKGMTKARNTQLSE